MTSSDKLPYTFDFEHEEEQNRLVDQWSKVQSEEEHERRRISTIELGVFRQSIAERILKQLPDPKWQSNTNWWLKLESWIAKHPYKPDEIDKLVDAAHHPERYQQPVSTKLPPGKHMKGRKLSAATKSRMSEALKRRWAKDHDVLADRVRDGQKRRREAEAAERERKQRRPY